MLTAFRPLTNEATKMVKASAIASMVTILDLLGITKMIYNDSLDFVFFYVAACIYLVMIGGMRLGAERWSRRHAPSLAGARHIEARRSGSIELVKL